MRHRFQHFIAATILVGGLSHPLTGYAYAPAAGESASIGAQTAAVATVATATVGRREVFGFALASSLTDPSVGYSSWNFSALTTVAFFGLHIDSGGAIVADGGWTVWSSAAISNLVTVAHAHGTRVVLTVVLQDFQPGTPSMCAALVNGATTVNHVVAQVMAKRVDGVNIDYEGLNGTCPNGQTTRAMLTTFVSQLRAALPAGSYLSVDTYASSAMDPIGFFDIAALSPYVDSFFVMAYDLEYSNYRRPPLTCAGFCLGPTSPLGGYYYNDTSTVSQYVAVVPPAKVILGVPYYGRKACVGGVTPNAYPIGPVTADTYLSATGEQTDSAVTPGSYSIHRDAMDPSGAERWDAWFNASLGCTRELYWDDVTSLGLKYDLVNRAGLRGVGIWNLNYGGGAPELWSALLSHFSGCAGVATSSAPAGSAAVGTPVTVNAAAQQCVDPNPVYAFWVQAPGSNVWQLLQQYSTVTTLSWSTAGKAPGIYRFSVWAKDAMSGGIFGNSLGRWDSYATFTYMLVATPCTAVAAAPSPATGAVVGTAVTVTATATGCPHPQYEFWLLRPASSTWQLAQAYSPAATFSWSTTGAPSGGYQLSIWARDATSRGSQSDALGSWDAYSSSPYLLDVACSSVAASMSAVTVAIGATVAVGASAASCASPVFAVWMLAPGTATWQQIKAYSATSALAWTTAGRPTGTYQFSIWARDSLSPGLAGNTLGRWDTYTTAQVTVVAPCTSVAITFTPQTTATKGTNVALTASASGCSSPQYEFWVLAPGASAWQLLQAYSAVGTVTWTTGGWPAGAYHFSVWARQTASPGLGQDALGSWDAYTAAAYTLT